MNSGSGGSSRNPAHREVVAGLVLGQPRGGAAGPRARVAVADVVHQRAAGRQLHDQAQVLRRQHHLRLQQVAGTLDVLRRGCCVCDVCLSALLRFQQAGRPAELKTAAQLTVCCVLGWQMPTAAASVLRSHRCLLKTDGLKCIMNACAAPLWPG